MLFLLILYVGNKASLTGIKSLEMRYCGVPLYTISDPSHSYLGQGFVWGSKIDLVIGGYLYK